jgi:hypothetical protein
MTRGQRMCVDCGRTCWAEYGKNFELARKMARGRALPDPEVEAYEKAMEKRGLEDISNLCAVCITDLLGLAESIENFERRKMAESIEQVVAELDSAGDATFDEASSISWPAPRDFRKCFRPAGIDSSQDEAATVERAE